MGSSVRRLLPDGSFIEYSFVSIRPDKYRRHGVRYRLAWIQDGMCRVLFDNHHGKSDHCHIDAEERTYQFTNVDELFEDFLLEVRKLGGSA